MSIVKEFQKFAIKGNAVDMAVGIVIGAAFGNEEMKKMARQKADELKNP